MSVISSLPLSVDLNNIRENYDTSNPVVAEILKVKEQRLRILQEINKQQKEQFPDLNLPLVNNYKRSSNGSNVNRRKSEPKPRSSLSQNSPIAIRRSARLQNSPRTDYKEDRIDYKEEEEEEVSKTPIVRPPNDYGPIPGVEVGHHWETRMQCSQYGVHRPTVAGIHGGPDGAYSIALSGGYPEDVDEGDSFIYTGAGGRDLKGTSTKPKNLRVAPQTKDQELEGTNLSLVKSIESKLPIRVIRGYKSPSVFAPEWGYRYDGLYRVVEYWEDVGKTGYRIYRFRMERIKDQAPPPWEKDKKGGSRRGKVERSDNECSSLSDDDDDDDVEFKENKRPSNEDASLNNTDHVTGKEVKDIDNEIETCINFFCKTSPVSNVNEFKNNGVDEDFPGWDSP